MFPGLSPIQVSNLGGGSPEAALKSVADGLFMAGPGNAEIVVVLTPESIGHIEAGGWWKEQVAEYLWERSRRTAGEWEAHGYPTGSPDADELVGVTTTWEGITVIVAGGKAGSFSAVIPLWGGGSNSRSVSKVIHS